MPHAAGSWPRMTQFAQLNDPAMNATGSPTAFNLTYAMTDLYTNSSNGFTKSSPFVGNLTWFSSVNRTVDNSPIPGTDFRFNITTSSAITGSQNMNWNLPIPKGCYSNYIMTILQYDFTQP